MAVLYKLAIADTPSPRRSSSLWPWPPDGGSGPRSQNGRGLPFRPPAFALAADARHGTRSPLPRRHRPWSLRGGPAVRSTVSRPVHPARRVWSEVAGKAASVVNPPVSSIRPAHGNGTEGGHLVRACRGARAVAASGGHGWPRPMWGWTVCHLRGQRRVDGIMIDETSSWENVRVNPNVLCCYVRCPENPRFAGTGRAG